MKKLRYKRS